MNYYFVTTRDYYYYFFEKSNLPYASPTWPGHMGPSPGSAVISTAGGHTSYCRAYYRKMIKYLDLSMILLAGMKRSQMHR